MTQAIELNSVRRGYDPRDFTLVAAGGAGGAVRLRHRAASSRSRACSCPPHPGIIAATGLLATDLQHEFVGTERHALKTLDRERAAARFAELVAQAVAQLDADEVPEDRRLVRRLADCRYAGQGYEVRFEVPAGADRRRLGRGAGGALPRRPRGASTAIASTRRSRSSTSARSASAASTSCAWRELEAGDGDPSARRDAWSARSSSRSTAPAERRADAVLRARAAARRRPARRARRSSSSTTRRPSSRPASTAEIDRHGNIVIDCTTRPRSRGRPRRAGCRRRSSCASSAARSPRSPRRWRASSTACPTRRSSASPRTSARASSTARATTSPSRTRRRCSWARCRRSSRT